MRQKRAASLLVTFTGSLVASNEAGRVQMDRQLGVIEAIATLCPLNLGANCRSI